MVSKVPEACRSSTPAQLREIATDCSARVRNSMAAAAAEIEGGEEAFAVVVGQKRALEVELRTLRANHERTLDFLARWRELFVALQAERPDDVRLARALAGEHPMRPAPRERPQPS
ncbi:hypothetical protein NTJ56_20850 [Burkholderia contaminans]|uniref:hypothetical protein n=1 Tax=Burkholderia contaminans TaxID=488447 RepID=UPI001CF21172|nr:hypothetical protein [Burkholderia contaminans]MCA7915710.1 hypothetical protein [Burkholderia contaminans]UUX40887.1 hypothetical protein NTJ56_20850 [Burkholderia contaminans]